MNDFLPLNDADRLIASITGDPLFVGKARRLAGDGTLKISFYYRGPIGVFPISKVPDPDKKAVNKYSFNGHLTAVARPQLDLPTEKISSKGIKKQLRDWLTVREVTLGQGILPTEPGYFIGRVRTWLDGDRLIRHTTDNLDSSLLPVSKWRIASDEIRAVFQKPPAPGAVVVETGGDGQGQSSQERPPAPVATTAAPAGDHVLSAPERPPAPIVTAGEPPATVAIAAPLAEAVVVDKETIKPETPAGDFVSADESGNVKPTKCVPRTPENGLLTRQIAYAFDGVNDVESERWIKNLSAAREGWAKNALIGLGEQGGASSVWRPLELAQLIHSRAKGDRAKQAVLKQLHKKFKQQTALVPWRDAFNEFFTTFFDAD